MAKICVDTSWLISLGDENRGGHKVANEYFDFCMSHGHTLCLPTLVVSEFAMKADPFTIPLQYFKVLPLNYEGSILAAHYQREVWNKMPVLDEPRPTVRNDIYIIAQANVENCVSLLTEDANSMSKWAQRLKDSGDSSVTPILLVDGFAPNRMTNPDQYLF